MKNMMILLFIFTCLPSYGGVTPNGIDRGTYQYDIKIDGKLSDWEALKDKTTTLKVVNDGLTLRYIEGYRKTTTKISHDREPIVGYRPVDYFVVTSTVPFEQLGELYITAAEAGYKGRPFTARIGKTYRWPPLSPDPRGGTYLDYYSIQKISYHKLYGVVIGNSGAPSSPTVRRINGKMSYDDDFGLYVAEFKIIDGVTAYNEEACVYRKEDPLSPGVSYCGDRYINSIDRLEIKLNYSKKKRNLAKAYAELGDLMLVTGCKNYSECRGLRANYEARDVKVSDITTLSVGIHATRELGGLSINLNTNFDEIRFAANLQKGSSSSVGTGLSFIAYNTGDVKAVSAGAYRYGAAAVKAPTVLPTTTGVIRVVGIDDPSIKGAGFQFEIGTPGAEAGVGMSWDLTDLTSDEILTFIRSYNMNNSGNHSNSSNYNPNYGGRGDNHRGNDSSSPHAGGVWGNSDGGVGINTPWGGR
ncbi:hypothetical protein C9980_25240 [Vibrio mediterranei]|uniref:hypothetical protein n=1 Tax=Vibrio mediterranei TaxID=689 RepID=UPI000D18519F|nr:hypothetical protein [Vibrio mediterranei]PTC02005.1 hypothetical protein C9980_25240 [Vibrio mediterranei]